MNQWPRSAMRVSLLFYKMCATSGRDSCSDGESTHLASDWVIRPGIGNWFMDLRPTFCLNQVWVPGYNKNLLASGSWGLELRNTGLVMVLAYPIFPMVSLSDFLCSMSGPISDFTWHFTWQAYKGLLSAARRYFVISCVHEYRACSLLIVAGLISS